MVESHLEARSHPEMLNGDKHTNNGAPGVVCCRKSTHSVSVSVDDPEIVKREIIEGSKQSTVEGVLAEDLPDLIECVLNDQELYKSLR